MKNLKGALKKCTNLLWHVNLLLGNDREISKYTTAITE
jgi:hypothetical protein